MNAWHPFLEACSTARAGALCAVAFLGLQSGAPPRLAAQDRGNDPEPRISFQVDASYVRGSTDFRAAGASLGAEARIRGGLRAYVQWADWDALASCTVADGPSTCNADADSWEVGIRHALGGTARVVPFVGAGIGVEVRDGDGVDELDDVRNLMLSLGVGLDYLLARRLRVRFSIQHQEVPDDDFEERFGESVRFTAFRLGGSMAVH